jgi:hypothetical protein
MNLFPLEVRVAEIHISTFEILSNHSFENPHVVKGVSLHGGFDACGEYLSPRSFHRLDAIRSWTASLLETGGFLCEPDPLLLQGPSLPNLAQWRFLLERGIWQPLWSLLTQTAVAEGRGRLMAAWTFPDLQEVVEEDISQMAVGHWNKGLLRAHGLDEGGDIRAKIGGHEAMWFLIRDLAFGEIPSDERPKMAPLKRLVPKGLHERVISAEHYKLIAYVMNLFLVECRAEAGFDTMLSLFGSPELFPGHEADLPTAKELLLRIDQDEQIHLESMKLYLGELRELTFKGLDGQRINGSDLVDGTWGRMVHWTIHDQKRIEYLERRSEIHALLAQEPEGRSLIEAFDGLGDAPQWHSIA